MIANDKDITNRFSKWMDPEIINLFKSTKMGAMDFEDFLDKYPPQKNDFVFLDPPYDTEFSTYAKNEFNRNDQIRLAFYLMHKIQSKWMLIIKNTDFIYNLYSEKPGISIHTFSKKYLVSFKNRNDKKVEHLVITNY